MFSINYDEGMEQISNNNNEDMELASKNHNENMKSKSHNSDEILENLEDHEEKKKIIEDFLNFFPYYCRKSQK